MPRCLLQMARSVSYAAVLAVVLLASSACAWRVEPEDNAYKLASKLVDKHSLRIMRQGRKAAKYLGHDHSAGIAGSTVVFTTGASVKDAMDPKCVTSAPTTFLTLIVTFPTRELVVHVPVLGCSVCNPAMLTCHPPLHVNIVSAQVQPLER